MNSSSAPKNKSALLVVIVTVLIVITAVAGGALVLMSDPQTISAAPVEIASNILSVDGKQIIVLNAKSGFNPAFSVAKANTDTILKVKTAGTFDCSSTLNIPKLGISKTLPATGTTDIQLGSYPSGTEIKGTCSMGMYNFTIQFS